MGGSVTIQKDDKLRLSEQDMAYRNIAEVKRNLKIWEVSLTGYAYIQWIPKSTLSSTNHI